MRKALRIDYGPFQIPGSIVTVSSKPYKYATIKKLGFTTTFSCQLDACGTQDQAEILGALICVEDNVYNYYRKPYYLVAEKPAPKGNDSAQVRLSTSWSTSTGFPRHGCRPRASVRTRLPGTTLLTRASRRKISTQLSLASLRDSWMPCYPEEAADAVTFFGGPTVHDYF